MCRLADKILTQRRHGLITEREARQELRRLARQARFNADYADCPRSFERWRAEQIAAERGAAVVS